MSFHKSMRAVCFVFLLSVVSQEAAIPPFKDQCMKWHNEYRKRHQVDSVKWNDTLAKEAEGWANYLALNNTFEHEKNIGAGENLYLSGSPTPEEPCTEATQLFYEEVKEYNFSNPGFSSKTGHFTQVVWKHTKQIGAAQAPFKGGRLIIVVRYSPAGNVDSEKAFRENVLPEKRQNGGVGPAHSSLGFIGFVVATGVVLKNLF